MQEFEEKGIGVRYEGRGLKLVIIRILQNSDAVFSHCKVTSAHINSQLQFLSPLLSPVIPQFDAPVYSVMRSTRLPLGGVMLSGKKFTKVSKS